MFYMMKKYDLTTEAGRSFMEILFPGPSLREFNIKLYN